MVAQNMLHTHERKKIGEKKYFFVTALDLSKCIKLMF